MGGGEEGGGEVMSTSVLRRFIRLTMVYMKYIPVTKIQVTSYNCYSVNETESMMKSTTIVDQMTLLINREVRLDVNLRQHLTFLYSR